MNENEDSEVEDEAFLRSVDPTISNEDLTISDEVISWVRRDSELIHE